VGIKSIKKWTPYREWDQLDLVLDVEQLCAVLRITEPTALKLLQSGEIPGWQIARRWRISRDALRAKLEGRPADGQAACG
jgi:excisionase family DNA binding protein